MGFESLFKADFFPTFQLLDSFPPPPQPQIVGALCLPLETLNLLLGDQAARHEHLEDHLAGCDANTRAGIEHNPAELRTRKSLPVSRSPDLDMESTTPSLGDKRPAQAAEATTSSLSRKKTRAGNAFTIQETNIKFDPSLVAIRMEQGVVTLTPKTLALGQTKSNDLAIEINSGDASEMLSSSLLDIFKEENAPARWYELYDNRKAWSHSKSSPLTFEVKLASILWDSRQHENQIKQLLNLKCVSLEPAMSLLKNNEKGLRCLLVQLGAPHSYNEGAIEDHLYNMVMQGYPGRGVQHDRTAWRHATELTRILLQMKPSLSSLKDNNIDSTVTAASQYTLQLREITGLFSGLCVHIETSFKEGRLEKRVRAKAVEYGQLPNPDSEASEAYYQKLFTPCEPVNSGEVASAFIQAVVVDPNVRSEDWIDDVASFQGDALVTALDAGLDPASPDVTRQPPDSAQLHPAHHAHNLAQLWRLGVKACSIKDNKSEEATLLLKQLDKLQQIYCSSAKHNYCHLDYIQVEYMDKDEYKSVFEAMNEARWWYDNGGWESTTGDKPRPNFDLEGPDWLFEDQRLLDMLDGGTYWLNGPTIHTAFNRRIRGFGDTSDAVASLTSLTLCSGMLSWSKILEESPALRGNDEGHPTMVVMISSPSTATQVQRDLTKHSARLSFTSSDVFVSITATWLA
ncbi:hypothetical protein LIA77_03699 [Sarocladium implicatum]|nr:hypothetical protein LIA77_03699 [Sarocladium implicatum]